MNIAVLIHETVFLCVILTCEGRFQSRSWWGETGACEQRSGGCCAGRDDNCDVSGCYCDEYCKEARDCCEDNFCQGKISDTCLDCICQVESNCRPLGCSMDGDSDACGYFQIHLNYYRDCNRPEPAGGCSGEKDCWIKCSQDLSCSKKCVRAYMQRYKNMEGAGWNCESYARLHNGGPNGANRQRPYPPNYDATTPYWNKVQNAGCTRKS